MGAAYPMTFLLAKGLGNWVPIRDCPGRFVLRGVSPTLGISDILPEVTNTHSFSSPNAIDQVYVAILEGGGVISYRKMDASWVHTLCDQEGFKRKLDQLQIPLLQ